MKNLIFLSLSLMLLGSGCVEVNIDSLSIPQDDLDVTTTSDPNVTINVSSRNTEDLSGQNLSSIPQSIFNKRNLEELDVSNNTLTGALPSEIRNLQNLRILNASNNNFTGIPAEIGQLDKLEILDYSNNDITGLPNELGNLSNLRILDLSGNNPSEFDLNIIRESLADDVEIRL